MKKKKKSQLSDNEAYSAIRNALKSKGGNRQAISITLNLDLMRKLRGLSLITETNVSRLIEELCESSISKALNDAAKMTGKTPSEMDDIIQTLGKGTSQ